MTQEEINNYVNQQTTFFIDTCSDHYMKKIFIKCRTVEVFAVLLPDQANRLVSEEMQLAKYLIIKATIQNRTYHEKT